MATCEHCGQETGIIYGAVWDRETIVKLCHTGDPDRPDCYRRVTVYHEYLGILKDADPLPAGVENIRDVASALTELTSGWGEFSEVCVTHKRFVPCRKTDGTCVFSTDDDDVNKVREYQTGK